MTFDVTPFQFIPNPVLFRPIPDSLAAYYVEASECCLIHYDNPVSATAGVWINPTGCVGYPWPAYAAVTVNEWPTVYEFQWGPWKNRWLWRIRDPFPSLKASWRIWRWRRRYPDVHEPGFACMQDLVMVITTDGWRSRGGSFQYKIPLVIASFRSTLAGVFPHLPLPFLIFLLLIDRLTFPCFVIPPHFMPTNLPRKKE